MSGERRREGDGEPRWRGASGEGGYLITGGLGALGLQIAGWLVGQGALRLVLTGRRALAPDGPAADMVARWRARGVTVETVAADVADTAAMARVVETLGPVRGVVHAAGVATPAPLVALTKDGLAAELRAKCRGAGCCTS